MSDELFFYHSNAEPAFVPPVQLDQWQPHVVQEEQLLPDEVPPSVFNGPLEPSDFAWRTIWYPVLPPLPEPDELLVQSVWDFHPVPFVSLYGDSIRWYFTGAASHNGTQADPDASLGNYRSSTEAERAGVLEANAIPNVKLLMASRENGTDGVTSNIFANGTSTLQYFSQGSDADSLITTINNGETRVLFDDDNPNAWVRVTRDTADSLVGGATLEFTDIWNNVFSMLDAGESESASGGNRYRGVMMQNAETFFEVSGIKVYVPYLNGPSTSSAAQLASSGSGTIQGTTNAFCGWSNRGWCEVRSSGGTLKEIVYYSSRTDSTLTVPSLGRARLGTSATAGSASDLCYEVSPVRIAIEAPVSNAIQTIPNESTAPTGVTWSTARTAGTGLSVGSLSPSNMYGLWIHRELPAGVSANAKHFVKLSCDYTLSGVTYTESLTGMFRIADNDIERYELFVGTNAQPDFNGSPTETFTSLPYTTTMSFTAGNTYYLVTQKRNKHNLVTDYRKTTVLTIDAGGNEQINPPSNPEVTTWEAAAGGAFYLEAVYFYNGDSEDQQADTWLLYITTNGVDPDPSTDTPVEVAMSVQNGEFADMAELLRYTTSTFAHGTTGKIIVRTRRSGTPDVDSNSLTVYTATATTAGPSAPTGGAFYRQSGKVQQ